MTLYCAVCKFGQLDVGILKEWVLTHSFVIEFAIYYSNASRFIWRHLISLTMLALAKTCITQYKLDLNLIIIWLKPI
jgi:hypothetical protein